MTFTLTDPSVRPDAPDPPAAVIRMEVAYLMIAVGWIFVTTIAVGIVRVLRRQ